MREKLADIEHTRWSGWQEYLHSKCIKNSDGSLIIPAGYVFHLERLIKTPYSELTEKEKDSDRAEVDKSLKVFKQEILGKLPETKETDGLREAPNAWHWAEGFNACLAQVRKIIKCEL